MQGLRCLVLFLLACVSLFALAQGNYKPSSALNIPTPTYQRVGKPYRFNGFYAGFDAGAADPGGDHMASEFDVGYLLNPFVGYQWGQGRIEFSPSFVRLSPEESTVTRLALYGVMVNGYYDFTFAELPISQRLVPFVGAGLGAIYPYGGSNASSKPNRAQWGYQALLGLKYRINFNWRIEFTYHLLTWANFTGHINAYSAGVVYYFY